MIEPFVDILGKMSPNAQRSETLSMIESELNVRGKAFAMLSAMDIASYGNAFSTDTISIPVQTLVVIPHNLGYIPLFLAYFTSVDLSSTTYRRMPFYITGAGGGVAFGNPNYNKIGFGFRAIADDTNLYIQGQRGFVLTAPPPPSGWQFRYYIFKQPQA